ncbi:MAG: globin domain-containing protein [Alphaproteobacteria bacterium]
MTPSQIRLVRDSFRKIEPIANQVGQAFYDKLFEAAPETRKLFKRDMSFQHAKFMSVMNELVGLHLRSLISLPVTLLNSSEAAMPTIYELGKRHVHFGVTPMHFGLMRSALLETLSELLGDEFTPRMREAWEAAFDVMANVMRKGLENSTPSSDHFLDRFEGEQDAKVQNAPSQFFNS